jgi:hypothetical protein
VNDLITFFEDNMQLSISRLKREKAPPLVIVIYQFEISFTHLTLPSCHLMHSNPPRHHICIHISER